MKKLRTLLCALCLILLIPLLLRARDILPLDTRPLVEEKYAGWSGVLRLWVFEGWPCGNGSLSPWLNRCVSGFEKAHPGVYIQPQFVDAGALASFNDSGILPPDMLLFPPGLLSEPFGLLPLDVPTDLRPALANCGVQNGAVYAVPVAMGGYLWAWNAALIDGLPDSWQGADATLSVPIPERWRHWDGALLALCSGRYSEKSNEEALPETSLPGLDLGLGETETPAPTAAPISNDDAALPRRLPEGFQFDGDAWKRFINGEAAATLVTQREVRRLQALSDQGKGPDWRLAPGDSAFTDQLLCLALVDRPDASAQQALCSEFLSHLLSDESQGSLHLVSAFSVTDAASGYGPSDPLATMEAALRNGGLTVPRCLNAEWSAAAEEIVRKFVADEGEAPALWRHFREVLEKNPND